MSTHWPNSHSRPAALAILSSLGIGKVDKDDQAVAPRMDTLPIPRLDKIDRNGCILLCKPHLNLSPYSCKMWMHSAHCRISHTHALLYQLKNRNYFCDPYWELSAPVLKSTNRACSVLGGEPLPWVISLLGCSVSDSISTGSWNFLLLQHSVLQCLPQQLIIFFWQHLSVGRIELH